MGSDLPVDVAPSTSCLETPAPFQRNPGGPELWRAGWGLWGGGHSKDGEMVVSDGGHGGSSWGSSQGSTVRMERRWSLMTAYVILRGSPAPSPEHRRLTWPQGTSSWQPQHMAPGVTDSWNQSEAWPGGSHLSQDWTSPAEPQTPMPGMVKGPGRKDRALPARGWRSQAGFGSHGPDLELDLHAVSP